MNALRDALKGPLAFAAADDYAHITRLKDFSKILEHQLRVHTVEEKLADELRRLANRFDEQQSQKERIASFIQLMTLLDGESKNPHDSSLTHRLESYQDPLAISVQFLPKVGPKRAERLQNYGICTIRDLLNLMPRAYSDRRKGQSLASLEPGQTAVVSGTILRCRMSGMGKSKRLEAILQQDGEYLKLIFFHGQKNYLVERFTSGAALTVVGQISKNSQVPTMVHPRIFNGEKSEMLSGIWPLYPEISGLGPTEIGQMMQSALSYLKENPPLDIVPESLRRSARIAPLLDSYCTIHAPASQDHIDTLDLMRLNNHEHIAFRRMAFDELLAFQLNMQQKRLAFEKEKSTRLSPTNSTQLLRSFFPFEPTQAQVRVTQEILDDTVRPFPMARLVQGDVGAGKTAVAMAICLHMAEHGLQSALMVPTEILAQQHLASFSKLLAPKGLRIALLSSSTKAKERSKITQALLAGDIHVIIGTHALLSDDVHFADLGLCIIDEQHRFGVEQRSRLRAKGEKPGKSPHLLAMTATPIPRSLALTLYGDLALSVIDEMPKGRKAIHTRVLYGDIHDNAIAGLRPFIEQGQKAYIIYPLVEESEKMDLADASSGYSRLSQHFGESRCALLHGRMSQAEKEAKMLSFAKGDVQILVSTTVVEVGVDVPEATCMVIMHAERFGLSQLHQLRGRVGRGSAQSHCLLLSAKFPKDDDGTKRLGVMESSHDGFYIANIDLEIRGPGDFVGTRQSGLPVFSCCDLVKHADLIEPARNFALELLQKKDPAFVRGLMGLFASQKVKHS